MKTKTGTLNIDKKVIAKLKVWCGKRALKVGTWSEHVLLAAMAKEDQ